MKYEQAKQIIIKELIKRGYAESYEIIDAKTTQSHYFKIKNGLKEINFRVSDHKPKDGCRLITLRLDYAQSDEVVRSFIKNRVLGIGNRVLYN